MTTMKYLSSLILLLFCTALVRGQQSCSGNFGENIFDAGDFGRGTGNILQDDPGFAPGYSYTRSPPPNDGFYTITNNTGLWNLFGGWMSIINSSPDPSGYMMVVNASFEPGIFYEQEIDGLCENTSYFFSTDIINLIDPGWDELIKPRVSFLINGETQYDTGEIDQNGSWNTYGFSFRTEPGETTLTLALRNNAPGGIGNDLALDNIFFRPCGPEALILPRLPANICEDGDPIPLTATIVGDEFPNPVLQWQQSFDEGDSWQDIPGANDTTILHTDLRAGNYYYRYYLANSVQNLSNVKCRINSNIKIVRVLPKEWEVRDTFCAGTTFTFGDQQLSTPGNYVDSLVSSIGCDSIVYLTLAEVPAGRINLETDIQDATCFGRSDGEIQVRTTNVTYPPTRITLGTQSVVTDYAIFSNLAADTFTLEVTDRYGCRLETTLDVVEPPPVSLDVGPDRSLQLGDELVLEPSVNQPFEILIWEGGLSGSCGDLNCFPISLTPLSDTTIFWTVQTAPNCQAMDTLRVSVDASRQLYAPNAFSPNFDGRNDYFGIFGREAEVLSVSVLRVFDRWGGLVYEGEDLAVNAPDSGWDGRLNGELLPQGIYTYQAQVTFLDGVTRTKTGSVLLIR